MFYTNVSRLGDNILFRGVQDGERVTKRIKYRPTHYVEDRKNPTQYKSLYGIPVSPIEFDSMSEATGFRRKYKDVPNFPVYGMENYIYQFIAEAFPHDIQFNQSQIRIGSIDIEVYSGAGFPDPTVAEQEVISITYKDYQHNTFYVWGLKDYDPSKNEKNIQYFKCSSETDMLVAFTNWWCSVDNCPDVITGWNSKMFDMPYLINRIVRTIGEETVKKFSPWNKLQPRTSINKMGQEENYYEIVGVSQLDYYDLFLKFGVLTYGRQERYTLDHVAYQVLGAQKVDYSEYRSLQNLYEQNHQLFIDYNIVDVDLVDKLEQTMNLIGLVFTMAYKAKVNYNDAFGTTGIWDAVVYNELRKRNIVVPAKKNNIKTDIVGGYVKDPLVIGQVDWIMSFDFESLYPNIMVQYNISPETLVDLSYEGPVTLPANNARFRSDVEGIFPQVIKKFYGDRRAAKAKMLETKLELKKIEEEMERRGSQNLTDSELIELYNKKKEEYSTHNNEQMAIKISMNSLYGACSNVYFRYYDSLVAESVTTTGQRSIKHAESAMNESMNSILKTDNADYVVAIDTDSIYVNMKPMVDRFRPMDPVNFLSKIGAEHFKDYFTKVFDDYAKETNAYTNRMVLEREVIADRGIWCCHPKTKITVNGIEYTMEEYHDMVDDCDLSIVDVSHYNAEIESFDLKKQERTQDRIDLSLRKWYSGDMYKLTQDGKTVYVTGEHQVLTKNNESGLFDRWVRAKDLTEDDELKI